MDFGAAMFFTDYSMTPDGLAEALEARGFESVWAPEHSHIPTSRTTPFPQGGELPKKYYDAIGSFRLPDRRCGSDKDAEDRDRSMSRRPARIRSRRQTSSPRSTRSPAGASCSESAAAGTPRRWPTTAPCFRRASS